ncbi:MAG: carboxypeptidase-like regulatory domain-containing protein, partial [Acidobacteriota bacterium]
MHCNTSLALFAIPLVLILFSTLTLAGQSGPAVTGTVVDRSGGAVSGARVQLTDVRSQTTEVRTDAQGNFSLPAIEAPSRLRVDASGFAVRVLNLT